MPARVMIDFSHGNSSKNPQKQVDVAADVARQVGGGDERIFGVMVESHLKAGRQDLVPGQGARLRSEHHRRLHRLGRQPRGARPAGGSGAPAPAEGAGRIMRAARGSSRMAGGAGRETSDEQRETRRCGRGLTEGERYMAQAVMEAGPDQGLGRLERVGKGSAIADQIYGLVGKSLFFAEFSREDILILAGYMDVYRVQPGEVIITEGDAGDYMLLIVEGYMDILKKGVRHDQQHMTTVGPGMTLGEMSMIDGEPRFATCVATEATTFAVLHRDDMAKIILEHPSLGSKILVKLVSLLSSRLRQTSARLLQYLEGI